MQVPGIFRYFQVQSQFSSAIHCISDAWSSDKWSQMLWTQVGSYIMKVFRYMVNFCWTKPWTISPMCSVVSSDRIGGTSPLPHPLSPLPANTYRHKPHDAAYLLEEKWLQKLPPVLNRSFWNFEHLKARLFGFRVFDVFVLWDQGYPL